MLDINFHWDFQNIIKVVIIIKILVGDTTLSKAVDEVDPGFFRHSDPPTINNLFIFFIIILNCTYQLKAENFFQLVYFAD